MRKFGILPAVFFLMTGVAHAIEYNEPGPIEKMGKSGWMHEDGVYKGERFKSFLEWKRLLVADDAIYYVGVERVEVVSEGRRKTLHWKFKARCAVRPDLRGNVPLGLTYADIADDRPENFVELTETPANAERGWMNLWWAACKGIKRSF